MEKGFIKEYYRKIEAATRTQLAIALGITSIIALGFYKDEAN
jgi:hypothetical protein